MLPTTIHAAPSVDEFIPLGEYQSTTPASFHDGKPVLHYHATGARAWLPRDQQSRLPVFPADAPTSDGDSGEMVSQDSIELFITSENLTIFNTKTAMGIQIPYPSIALHAMQHKADPSSAGPVDADADADKAPCVLLQLDLSDGGADDETFDTVQLTLVPPTSSTDLSAPIGGAGAAVQSEQEKLFDAITACQNLHPDPADEDDEDDGEEDYSDRIIFESAIDGSAEAVEGLPGVFRGTATGDLPPPMPGSTGWITADNVGEYFDENGSWIGGADGDEEKEDGEEGDGGAVQAQGEEGLGEGAGRVRPREEANGHDDGESENKRPRTE
ncbi:hypothetical protein M406DRAFT_348571 [Cryphonectria parasitica EP155]|uniref:Benzoylformate decarboxylase n=1 Tax=Cryphonectria parasitica (strain ATCC 38755 / EP155) TaxID=660469 RepID=A0A9P4XTC6_CRYP1|nr:uncharacterized protein M406DRAFT_348571 [Cryphonectria parasitica EP155]KAF3760320.1 hypothetical protein M406DRAFT_348571 [Cryphonectria parasitica EP155]